MLRQVLGIYENELTIDAITSLITNQVAEHQFLDYKEKSPNNLEFAKDVAAMANAGGGIIIVGVSDENNRPKAMTPIALAGEVSRLEQVFGANIQPFVRVTIKELRTSDDEGVLVLEVVSNERPPYAVSEGLGRYGYYIRTGQHRYPLSEGDVDRFYRARHQLARQVDQRVSELAGRCNTDHRPKAARFYVVGSPMRPSDRVFRPTRDVLRALTQHRNDNQDAFLNIDVSLPKYVVPEFKRILLMDSRETGSNARNEHGWTELADDGCYLSVRPVEARVVPDSHATSALVDIFVTLDVIQLLAAYAFLGTYFRIAGDVHVRAGITYQGRLAMIQNSQSVMMTAVDRQPFLLKAPVATDYVVDIEDLLPGPSASARHML